MLTSRVFIDKFDLQANLDCSSRVPKNEKSQKTIKTNLTEVSYTKKPNCILFGKPVIRSNNTVSLELR